MNPEATGYALEEEPYYLPLADEVEVFLAAYQQRLPVLLKGPTGCGKTRFVEYMAHRIYRQENRAASLQQPLQTVACHEDLSATDLVGRYLLQGDETVWQDGPLTRAVKEGAICYLDEIVEARKDSTVLIHSSQTIGVSCRSKSWERFSKRTRTSCWSFRTTLDTRTC